MLEILFFIILLYRMSFSVSDSLAPGPFVHLSRYIYEHLKDIQCKGEIVKTRSNNISNGRRGHLKELPLEHETLHE